jgi:alpha-tubulin suppressor-like RCC1 family protein
MKTVGVGSAYGCGLDNEGIAYCWGRSTSGSLGLGADAPPDQCASSSPALTCYTSPRKVSGGLTFSSFSVGVWHVCGIEPDGGARCWGSNILSAIGAPEILGVASTAPSPIRAAANLKFTAVSAGTYFTCALATDKNAYCWGSNYLGQLGIGVVPLVYSGIPVRVMLPHP